MRVFEIGSEYDWDSNKKIEKSIENAGIFNKDCGTFKFLRSGRDALRYVAQSLKISKKTVLMPALCCSCMPEPFEDEDYEIIYYKLTIDFKVNVEDVLKKLKPNSIFLFMNYFAIPSLSKDEMERIVKSQKNVTTVEDITHDFLKRGVETYIADITVCSIRKWFAIPDGGLLYSKINIPEVLIDGDNFFAERRISAMKRKSIYLSNGKIEEKEIFRNELSEANQYIDTVKNISTMNCWSTEVLKHIDLRRMYTIRLKHCRKFLDELSSLDNIRLLESEAVKSTLYFPVLVKEQNIVQRKLAEKGIYAPIIWPLPKLAEGVCEIADDVADHMLGVPCDHRYTDEEILQVAHIIKEVT